MYPKSSIVPAIVYGSELAPTSTVARGLAGGVANNDLMIVLWCVVVSVVSVSSDVVVAVVGLDLLLHT